MKLLFLCLLVTLVTLVSGRSLDTSQPKFDMLSLKNKLMKNNHEQDYKPRESFSGKNRLKVPDDSFEEEELLPEEDYSKDPVSQDCSLEGAWYNQHGSELKILQHASEAIHGEYRTAVERYLGAAGNGPAFVHGTASSIGQTFGFSASWNKGESVTSWTGQCVICDGRETLLTTWILTSTIDTCQDAWMANRIGQDTFTHIDHLSPPQEKEQPPLIPDSLQ
ncbi:avidin-like [Glandiceps talaboti]